MAPIRLYTHTNGAGSRTKLSKEYVIFEIEGEALTIANQAVRKFFRKFLQVVPFFRG